MLVACLSAKCHVSEKSHLSVRACPKGLKDPLLPHLKARFIVSMNANRCSEMVQSSPIKMAARSSNPARYGQMVDDEARPGGNQPGFSPF